MYLCLRCCSARSSCWSRARSSRSRSPHWRCHWPSVRCCPRWPATGTAARTWRWRRTWSLWALAPAFGRQCPRAWSHRRTCWVRSRSGSGRGTLCSPWYWNKVLSNWFKDQLRADICSEYFLCIGFEFWVYTQYSNPNPNTQKVWYPYSKPKLKYSKSLIPKLKTQTQILKKYLSILYFSNFFVFS